MSEAEEDGRILFDLRQECMAGLATMEQELREFFAPYKYGWRCVDAIMRPDFSWMLRSDD